MFVGINIDAGLNVMKARPKSIPNGERQNGPSQLSSNSSPKVDFQESRVTTIDSLVLVCELDEHLGLSDLFAQHLMDSRREQNTLIPLVDLFRQSVYSRIAGYEYEDVDDAERVWQDPTFRLIGSGGAWNRGATMTSHLLTLESEMLAEEDNFVARVSISNSSPRPSMRRSG